MLPPDRLLHTFRITAGISTQAQPLGGWETPDCELRGHYAGGHYLSACALMYAACGDEDLNNNAGAVVAGLGQCQAALKSGQSQPVTMVPLNQVIHERYAVYWKVNYKTV